MPKTAVIIGAGPAGLTAAWRLLKETGIQPVVLEKTGHIGGLSRTECYHGNRIDLGGHRFFSKCAQVNDIWREILPLDDSEENDHAMSVRARVSHILYDRKYYDYPVSLNRATLKNMGLRRGLRVGFGYFAAVLHKRGEKSLEDFYINRFGRPLYKMFFEDYTEKLWGVHPREIAPDWGAQRVKSLSLRKTLAEALRKALKPGYRSAETSLVREFWYPKLGPGQLWEAMADQVRAMGGQVRLHSEVTGIELDGEGRIQSVRINGAEELPADCVISSMPVKELVAAMGGAPPAPVREIASGLPYRAFVIVGLLVEKLRLGAVPDNWIYIQERDVRVGRLQLFNNWSPRLVADPGKTWLGMEYCCDEDDAFWSMPRGEIIRTAVEELDRLGIADPADVLDSTLIRVEKAYPAYFGSYKDFGMVREYLDAIPNLYCVGRNGQHRYNNMDHSMLTAIKAVEAIRAGLDDRSAIWDVNTEEEYHEAKPASAPRSK